MRRWILTLAVAAALCLALAGLTVGVALVRFDLAALTEPGRMELSLATAAKRWFIRRGSAHSPASPPMDASTRLAIGSMQFTGRCAPCHGSDGRTPTEIGRWMNPRAPDLGTPRVQKWSDAELFWIVRNGIRMSGMPGFGKLMSEEETWGIVAQIRRIGGRAPVGNETPERQTEPFRQ